MCFLRLLFFPISDQVEVPGEKTAVFRLNCAEVVDVSRGKGDPLSSSHTASFFTLKNFPHLYSDPRAGNPQAVSPPLFFHAHFQSPELRDLSDYRCGECFCSHVLMH